MYEDNSFDGGDESEIDEILDVDIVQEKIIDNNQIVNPEQVKFSEILCFENLLLSSSNTVKLLDKSIIKEDMDILKDAPGVNILIFIDEDIKDIDKQCCDMMNDEERDLNLYSIMFINEKLAKEINDKYALDVTSQSVLTKEGIENEASTILSGQD